MQNSGERADVVRFGSVPRRGDKVHAGGGSPETGAVNTMTTGEHQLRTGSDGGEWGRNAGPRPRTGGLSCVCTPPSSPRPISSRPSCVPLGGWSDTSRSFVIEIDIRRVYTMGTTMNTTSVWVARNLTDCDEGS